MCLLREADQSPRSSAEVKNEWTYTYAPRLCPHNMDREQTNGTISIRTNKMQQYAGVYLLQNHSARVSCVHRNPSSGVHQTVTAASGTRHSIRAMTFLRGLNRPRGRKVVALTL